MIDENSILTGQVWGAPFDLHLSLRKSDNCVAQQSTFISRTAVQKAGYLDETLEMSMDWDLWVRIASRFPVMFVPRIWSRIRIWENTKTSTIFNLSGEDHVATVKKIIRDKELKPISRSMKRTALAAAYARIARIAYESGDDYRFRLFFLRCLLAQPALLGGNVHHLWSVFLFGPKLARVLSRTKGKLLGFFQNRRSKVANS
jgi:hypothetical protein